MFILHFLIALVSTAIASPIAGGGFTSLAELSSDSSVNGFSSSAEGPKEITHQFTNNNDEALIWQDSLGGGLISTPTIPKNSIAYSTKFVIAGAGHKVEKEVQKPVDQGERFQRFDCSNSNGVCCMGNPLVTNRAAQRCEQTGDIFDAGNEVLWPMDSRLGHYCYKPEYIDDCSKLLDEESVYRGFLCFSNCGDPKTDEASYQHS